MVVMRRGLMLPFVALCAWTVGCSDEARPGALDISSTCTGGACRPDAGPTEDAGYTGPVGTVRGTLFAMASPSFSPFKSSETPSLENPATISLHAYGVRYSADYTLDAGFELVDVPVGSVPLYVEDVDDGNDLMPSLIGVSVTEGVEKTVEVPVTTRSSLETILGGLAEPIELDSDRAQLIVTIMTCSLQGGTPITGAEIVSPTDSGGVVYETGGQWELNASGGTGSLGTAIVVNVPSDEYPGVGTSLTIVSGGVTQTTEDLFWTMQGAVTRVYYSLPCSE